MNSPNKIISVVGQCCPLPIIELAKAVKEIQPGEIIQVTGDDPIFDIGIHDFCEAQGFELLEIKKDTERQFTALIKC
jgi:tRNA 2-thiouridine synthesizing protein A